MLPGKNQMATKNIKLFGESLDEMDKNIKRMMKLMEEDGDSFAKRKPELISCVEEFHRVYDHLIGELKGLTTSDGFSDGFSETSDWSSPSPDQRLFNHKNGHRADESLLLDYESGSDDSSMNTEPDLPKLDLNSDVIVARNAELEEELRIAQENLDSSAADISRLKMELGEKIHNLEQENSILISKIEVFSDKDKLSNAEITSLRSNLCSEKEEFMSRVAGLEDEKRNLRDQIEEWETYGRALEDDIKQRVEMEEKFQLEIEQIKLCLAERENEIKALKLVADHAERISAEKDEIVEKFARLEEEKQRMNKQIEGLDSYGRALANDIAALQIQKSEAEEKLQSEISALKICISDRDSRISDLEKSVEVLNLEISEANSKIGSMGVEICGKDEMLEAMKTELQRRGNEYAEVSMAAEAARKMVNELNLKVEDLEAAVLQTSEEKREAIRQLCFSLEHYRDGYKMLRRAFVGNRTHKRVPVIAV